MQSSRVATIFHLMQLCDSALPVGGFSFSCALESAVAQGVVYNEVTLQKWVQTILRQTLFSDGVAALHAFRNVENHEELLRTDRELYIRKPSCEWRTMSSRMGRKLSELGTKILSASALDAWQRDILQGVTPGTYAVTQGVLFSLCGATERELFAAVGYGTSSMLTGAALRLMRITHYYTQQLLFMLAREVEELFDEVTQMRLEQIHGFAPLLDILASMHERGKERMFIS